MSQLPLMYIYMYYILSSIEFWSIVYVFINGSLNDGVNDEGYVTLNERMINERLISCSVDVSGLRNLHGRTDGRKQAMKCFSAAGRLVGAKRIINRGPTSTK
jgi:hypothetical protein